MTETVVGKQKPGAGKAWPPQAAVLSVLSVVCLLSSVSCLLFLIFSAGCADRSSPAAPPVQAEPSAKTTNSAAGPAASDLKPAAAIDRAEEPFAAPPAKVANSMGPTRDITFDAIKFEMQKEQPFVRSMITPAIEQLTQSKIRIRGYMLPSFQQAGLTQFVLVRDNMQCCFGPGAALYDFIVVQMDAGQTADFTNQPVAVEGVLSVDVQRGSDEKCLAVYHLQAQKVR